MGPPQALTIAPIEAAGAQPQPAALDNSAAGINQSKLLTEQPAIPPESMAVGFVSDFLNVNDETAQDVVEIGGMTLSAAGAAGAIGATAYQIVTTERLIKNIYNTSMDALEKLEISDIMPADELEELINKGELGTKEIKQRIEDHLEKKIVDDVGKKTRLGAWGSTLALAASTFGAVSSLPFLGLNVVAGGLIAAGIIVAGGIGSIAGELWNKGRAKDKVQEFTSQHKKYINLASDKLKEKLNLGKVAQQIQKLEDEVELVLKGAPISQDKSAQLLGKIEKLNDKLTDKDREEPVGAWVNNMIHCLRSASEGKVNDLNQIEFSNKLDALQQQFEEIKSKDFSGEDYQQIKKDDINSHKLTLAALAVKVAGATRYALPKVGAAIGGFAKGIFGGLLLYKGVVDNRNDSLKRKQRYAHEQKQNDWPSRHAVNNK